MTAEQEPSADTAQGAKDLSWLRANGWSVAVHNDYRPNGGSYTFWLFTSEDGRYVKGEGASDANAIAEARAKATRTAAARPDAPDDANLRFIETCENPPPAGEYLKRMFREHGTPEQRGVAPDAAGDGLLPCPFCGKSMEFVSDEDGEYWVHPNRRGSDCWLSTAWVSTQRAGEGGTEEWNRRAAPAGDGWMAIELLPLGKTAVVGRWCGDPKHSDWNQVEASRFEWNSPDGKRLEWNYSTEQRPSPFYDDEGNYAEPTHFFVIPPPPTRTADQDRG